LEGKTVGRNPLNPVLETPPFAKNPTAALEEVPLAASYVIEFQTEKGKRYTIVPKK
jgi:alpha-L-fucosidase 2